MKKILLGVLLGLLTLIVPVMAYDSGTPYTVTLKWIVPTDTTFSISLAGAESTIDFDDGLTSDSINWAQPDSQDNSTSTPIINITNDGNVPQNFSCNLTASIPTWAVLAVSNNASSADTTGFDTTGVLVSSNVSSGDSTSLYLWTNITNADVGTTERTFQITSVKAQ